jgi:hypothetical protein
VTAPLQITIVDELSHRGQFHRFPIRAFRENDRLGDFTIFEEIVVAFDLRDEVLFEEGVDRVCVGPAVGLAPEDERIDMIITDPAPLMLLIP